VACAITARDFSSSATASVSAAVNSRRSVSNVSVVFAAERLAGVDALVEEYSDLRFVV
jgi:hypothetical protein